MSNYVVVSVIQVGFLKFVCIPCYELLMRLVPTSKPMLAGCTENYQKWEKIAQEAKEKLAELENNEKQEA